MKEVMSIIFVLIAFTGLIALVTLRRDFRFPRYTLSERARGVLVAFVLLSAFTGCILSAVEFGYWRALANAKPLVSADHLGELQKWMEQTSKHPVRSLIIGLVVFLSAVMLVMPGKKKTTSERA